MKLFKMIKFAATQPSTLVVILCTLITSLAVYAKSDVCQATEGGLSCYLSVPMIIWAITTLTTVFMTYRNASASVYHDGNGMKEENGKINGVGVSQMGLVEVLLDQSRIRRSFEDSQKTILQIRDRVSPSIVISYLARNSNLSEYHKDILFESLEYARGVTAHDLESLVAIGVSEPEHLQSRIVSVVENAISADPQIALSRESVDELKKYRNQSEVAGVGRLVGD